MANKLKDTAPRPRIGKTAKDTRMARLIDINQVVDEVNNELFIIDGEQVIQDMRLTLLEADVTALPPTPTTTIVNITSAQILAMGTTPITLLPAPGVGMYYDIEKIILEYTSVTIDYTSTSDYLKIIVNDEDFAFINSSFLAWGNQFVTVTTSATNNVVADELISWIPGSSFNKTVTLIATNPVANPTDGDGTLRAIITYTIRTFGA